ncbi:MAG: hypothetical protein IKL80_01385 [Clostridia bacterium]|nr:hypothetical protein [Clostridia bacterium]
MFGYIRIDKDELKVRDYNLFKAYYCGVCQTLKKMYGFPARYFLSYDATFLALLMGAVQKEAPIACPGRCLANPMIKRPTLQQDAVLSYSAAVNVLLVWFKLKDDLADNHSMKAILLLPFLYGKQKKAQKKYPALYQKISEGLQNLSKLEKEHCKNAEAPAAAFGKLTADIFDAESLLSAENRRILSHMGFLLGRFIYLLDAWEDRDADAKKGSYNPFLLEESVNEDDVKLSLTYTLSELASSMELLETVRNREIIENIMYLGLKNVLEQVFSGRNNKKEKRHERPL